MVFFAWLWQVVTAREPGRVGLDPSIRRSGDPARPGSARTSLSRKLCTNAFT